MYGGIITILTPPIIRVIPKTMNKTRLSIPNAQDEFTFSSAVSFE